MAIAELILENSRAAPLNWSSEVWRTLDITSGSIQIILFLLSTTLNPIVFYHYWKLPSTVPNILYRLLAISDFMTNLARPLFIAAGHFSPRENKSLSVLIDTNLYSIIFTVMVRVSMTMSFTSVALLALTRAMKIQWPFYHIKKRYIFIWLSFIVTFISLVMIGNMVSEKNTLKNFICVGTVIALQFKNITLSGQDKQIQTADASLLSRLSYIPMYFHAVIAVLVSIWAAVALARTIQESKVTKSCGMSNCGTHRTPFQKAMNKFRGCGAIVIMNLTNVLLMVSLISLILTVKFADVKYAIGDGRIGFCQSIYVVQFVFPTIIASTNPLVLIKFNLELRRRVVFWRTTSQQQNQITPTSRLETSFQLN